MLRDSYSYEATIKKIKGVLNTKPKIVVTLGIGWGQRGRMLCSGRVPQGALKVLLGTQGFVFITVAI